MKCIICDGVHSSGHCLLPVMVKRCENCSKMIFDNESHGCNRIPLENRLGGYRTEIMAKKANAVFKMRVENSDQMNGADFYYYDVVKKCFVDLYEMYAKILKDELK